MNPRANHYSKNDRVPLSGVGESLATLQQIQIKRRYSLKTTMKEVHK